MKYLRIKTIIVTLLLSVNIFAVTNVDNDLTNLTVKDGILCLESQEQADVLVKELNIMSNDELIEFEDSYGYRSLAGLLYLSEQEDEDYYSALLNKGLSEETILAMMNKGEINEYSDFTLELIGKGILAEFQSEAGTALDITIMPTNSLKLINEDGITSIGDEIYVYTDKGTIIITGGDFTKITEFKNTLNSKGNPPGPIGDVKARGYVNIDGGDDWNCKSQGCVRLVSWLRLYKYWYFNENTGFKSKITLYLDNAGYKYSWNKWRRQSDYTSKFNGAIHYGVNSGLCNFSTGNYGTTYSVEEDGVGDYYDFEEWILKLHEGRTDCVIGGFIDDRKYTIFSDTYLYVELEPQNGENVHPTILINPTRNKNSWNDIEMDF